MRKTSLLLAAALLASMTVRAQAPQQKPQAKKPLEIYFLDTEGGQATLFVSPSGQSMLVDTGFAGNQGMPTPPSGAASPAAARTAPGSSRVRGHHHSLDPCAGSGPVPVGLHASARS